MMRVLLGDPVRSQSYMFEVIGWLLVRKERLRRRVCPRRPEEGRSAASNIRRARCARVACAARAGAAARRFVLDQPMARPLAARRSPAVIEIAIRL